MPLMYLAKVNLNSKIREVYKKNLDLVTVLNDVYKNFNDNIEYKEEKKIEYEDSQGNKKEFTRIEKYNFYELDKDEETQIVSGKLARSFKRPSEEEVQGKIKKTFKEEMISIRFYFDVKKELIAFSVRRSFGYNQFTNAFKNLLDFMNKKYIFEVFLKKDKEQLEKKLKTLKFIKRTKAIIIPPNANNDELEELNNCVENGYIKEAIEANAKKIKIELIETDDVGIDLQSRMLKDTISAVSKGYGDLTAYGVNKNNREAIIKSSTDAALTRVVPENLSNELYSEEASKFIASLIAEEVLNATK